MKHQEMHSPKFLEARDYLLELNHKSRNIEKALEIFGSGGFIPEEQEEVDWILERVNDIGGYTGSAFICKLFENFISLEGPNADKRILARAYCYAGLVHYGDNRRQYITISANMGNALAQAFLVKITHRTTENEQELMDLAKKSADQGEREGMYRLFYLYAYNANYSYSVCEKLCKKAADLGLVIAMHWYARVFNMPEVERFKLFAMTLVRRCDKYVTLDNIMRILENKMLAAPMFNDYYRPLMIVDQYPLEPMSLPLEIRKRIIFAVGEIFYQHQVSVSKESEGKVVLFVDPERQQHVNTIIKAYKNWCFAAKQAVLAWCLVAKRLRLYKDVAGLIARQVWELRTEANYAVNEELFDSFP